MRKLKNQYGFYLAVVWLVITPSLALADEITINLSPTVPYIDTTVTVDTTTAYTITTNTGPRTEVVDSQTVQRAGWVDSWITLYRGLPTESGTVIAQDDDGNHNAENNYFASRLSGTLNPDTYTIRATSYNYVVGAQTPTGTYTLSSNLIDLPDTNTASPPSSNLTTDTNTAGTANQTNTDTSTSTTNTTDTSTTTPTNTTGPTSPVPSQPQETIVVPVIPPSLPPSPTEIYTEPVPTPTIQPPELPSPEEVVLVYEEPAPVVEPLLEEIPTLPIPEIMPESPLIEPFETPIIEQEPITEITENQEPITAEQIENLVESLNEDGVLTEGEREEIAEALVEQSEGEPITAETITEAGLTYEDLPAATPVEVRQDESGNAVVITAEVAAALVVLESPVELLTTIFSDPAQALLAISSIGADMSDEERSESEQTIVAAVIVSGIAVQSATTAALAGSVGYRRRL